MPEGCLHEFDFQRILVKYVYTIMFTFTVETNAYPNQHGQCVIFTVTGKVVPRNDGY